MNFFIAIKPQTATAQEKQVRVVHGKPIFYDPAPVKEAKKLLTSHLILHRPDEPMTGALTLKTVWLFPRGKSHKNGEWRITKPDTDNLQKLLSDCGLMLSPRQEGIVYLSGCKITVKRPIGTF